MPGLNGPRFRHTTEPLESPDMSGPPPEPPRPSLDNIDIYCLKCGYNLRGLSGDPRRCPECFCMNPMGDAILPARLISEQLMLLETAPASAVSYAYLTVLFLLVPVLFYAWRLSRGDPLSLEPFDLCLIPAFITFVAWVLSAIRFRDSCKQNPAWAGVLLRYHLVGFGSVTLVLLVVFPFAWLVSVVTDASPSAPKPSWLAIASAAAIAGGSACVLAMLGPRLSSLAKGEMEHLQREVAVQIARQTLRKKLMTER